MMKGTTLIVTKKKYLTADLVTDSYIQGEDFLVYNKFNDKFTNDKVFHMDEEALVVVDGVILNNKELQKKYGVDDNFSLIKKMYKCNGPRFVDDLRGNFYVFYLDKATNTWHVMTNHLSTKQVYYYISEDKSTYVASNDLFDMIKVFKELGISYSLDELGAYYLLSFGYMIEDVTMISEIRRVDPGTIQTYMENKLTSEQYFFIDNENYLNDSEDKIIDNMYEMFSNSVDMAFRKDAEYGYKHISYLSGGLDSRMIGIAAKKLGYDDITTITFSQTDSRDEIIAKKISQDFKYDSIYRSLNNGIYLKDIEKAVDRNYGQCIYSGACHLLTTNELINLNNFGFIYNGNLADAMHGDYIEAPRHTKPSIENWMYTNRLKEKFSFLQPKIEKKYGNEERFAIYNRGINGILNGSVSSHETAETYEPYLDQDLIEYCSRMRPELKYKEKAFLHMIQKYYPEATQYKWQKWNMKPTRSNENFMGTFAGKVYRVLDGQIQKFGSQSNNMNPFDKWYNENEQLREFINGFIKDNFELLDPYSELKKDCEEIKDRGGVIEKTQLMTLLQFLRRINGV